MKRTKTPSFICELPLTLASFEERILGVRFEVGRQAYNALLGETLRRLDLMRESRAYQAARQIWDKEERSRAFRAVRADFGFQEYALHRWATIHIAHQWLGEHLDANTIQKLATRAYRAANEYAVGKRGRPRYKGKHQVDSLEGKSNRTGIRFRDEQVFWQGLTLRCQIDHEDPVIAHGLASRIKFVRLIRRKLNGQVYYWAQLICEGLPYRKPQHTLGQGVIGSTPARASLASPEPTGACRWTWRRHSSTLSSRFAPSSGR
jgi:putative transposase